MIIQYTWQTDGNPLTVYKNDGSQTIEMHEKGVILSLLIRTAQEINLFSINKSFTEKELYINTLKF